MSPLVVDVDGTLVLTDTLWEAFLVTLRKRPWAAVKALFYLPKGRAVFKVCIAEITPLEISRLPYNLDLLLYLASETGRKRRLILATGAPRGIANAIAAHFGLFEAVLCSDCNINLTGKRKAAAIKDYLNGAQFAYAGNSRSDLAVWAEAEAAVVVNARPSILRKIQKLGVRIDCEIPTTQSPIRLVCRRFFRPSRSCSS